LVVANAFSINMLQGSQVLAFVPIVADTARRLVQEFNDIYSVVGHESTARLLSQVLGVEIKANRENYIMRPDDVLLVFTVPFRLPEGRVLDEDELERIAHSMRIYLVADVNLLTKLMDWILAELISESL